MHLSRVSSALPSLLGAALVLNVEAQPAKIEQLAETKFINRNPTVSETGLVAWQQTDPEVSGGGNSEIMLYQNNQRTAISSQLNTSRPSSTFPFASGNHIIWNATFMDSDRVGADNLSWRIREVPLATNDIPELEAIYSIRFGRSSTNSAAPKEVAGDAPTNAVPAQADGLDPNFFPEQQLYLEEEKEARPVPKPESPDIPRRGGSGDEEIIVWDPDNGAVRLTRDHLNDFNPSIHENLIAWQKAKAWPFGWEIMVYDGQDRFQLTTNYYYDMAPQVHDGKVAWYGWDGNDFEIFLYDHSKKTIQQLTDNTFDDVSPVLDDGIVAWEAYPAVEADIYLWKEGQDVLKLSDNIEDDLNPRIWNGQVVWQGFDGDDFEIYRYDGEKTIKLTGNDYDDLNPDIDDGLICWMGYEENWDAEIFYWKGDDVIQLTTNDYEDRHPKTAAGKIVWQAQDLEKSYIFLASP